MTIRVNDRVIPAKHEATIWAGDGTTSLRAEIRDSNRFFVHHLSGVTNGLGISHDELDTLIELLHAVKAERADQSAPKRLVESDPLDIIAVEEPTA